MSIARGSIENPLLTWLLILGCLLGGLWGFMSVGRLEDPAFTIKEAVVSATYPGASAAQVAEEVTEPLESAIQQMSEIKVITSRNTPGASLITVEIRSTFGGDELPAIWNKLRNRVGDAAANLPDGVRGPVVNDSFGDVFGIFYAVSAPGFTDAEIHDLASFMRRELLTVTGVADVEVAGLPEEAIFVEPDMAQLVNQGISPAILQSALSAANAVQDAGHVETPNRRVRIDAPEGLNAVDEIAGLSIGVAGEVVNLADVARVRRGREETPERIIRFDGTEAFTLGVSGLSNVNIVEVGERVEAHLAGMQADIPYGVEISPIYQQHEVVDEASTGFLVNLAMSVGIVAVVLALFMGPRAAVVVGGTLLLTVVGTFFFMGLFSIEMERISLGALIIAMGMLVDNAIVVAEGMQIEMHRGRDARRAAQEVAGKTQIPLLGATVIGIMAFAGIGLSPDATGEFLFSLFAVIGVSLLLSWLLAVTATPLLAHYVFRQGDAAAPGGGYEGPVFRLYGRALRASLRRRWTVMIGLAALTAACFVGFGQVKQQFFPDSNTPLFFVHYKLPQGADIHDASADIARMEAWLAEREEVVSVAAFVGGGASRFMLTYAPHKSDPGYGHLIIRVASLEEIPPLRAELDAFGRAAFPEGEFRTARLVFGPGGGAPVEARFSGPDPDVLRALGREAERRMRESGAPLQDLRTDWRERELTLRPVYATERAQTAGIDRDDVATATLFATDGVMGGVYREDERRIPIVMRLPPESRDDPNHLLNQLAWSEEAGDFVPLAQMIDGFDYEVQDTLIHRRDRVPTLTVKADTPAGVNAAAAFSRIRAPLEAMELPVGYALEWGGEHENSAEAQESLGRQLPLSLLVMVLISILLFNALRQPVIIWLLVPMSVNGVVIGLLGSGLPFSFTALLGLLSLSGMLIKNGIVLVEEIDLVRAEGEPLTEAIVKACVSRLRPVSLAAATTILGMLPLLWDAFFASMAVTIMGGLAFASVLTLIAAPVFYYSFHPAARRAEAAG